MSDLDELRKAQAAQAVEYGTYVAAAAIFYDGVLAYNAGDPVPVSNVKLHGYDKDGLVTKVATDVPAVPSVLVTEKKA